MLRRDMLAAEEGNQMILSNEAYGINISKADYPLRSAETPKYSRIFNLHGYKESDFHAAFVIQVKTVCDEVCVALIGSFYADAEHCAVLDGSLLTILMDDEIVRFDLSDMSIVKHKSIGDETYFSIYSIIDGYLVHGELSILRLDKDFQQVWSFSGSDIWVIQEGNRAAFRIENDQIFLEDWNGIKYALNMEGKLLWDTYSK